MLRTQMQVSEQSLILRLEGRLAASDAEHVRTLVVGCDFSTGLIVDLTETTFVDAVGEATLTFLSRLGAKFIADDAYVLDLCQRLHLRIERNSS